MQNKITPLSLFLLFAIISACKTNDQSDVAFVNIAPQIDGKLDADLEYLDVKKFNYIWQWDNPVTDTARVTYRMAYTPHHLYVYIETDVDSVSYHRRGYSWGDGYKILLGIPQKDSLTNEYYELAYSPSLDKDHGKDKKYSFIIRHKFANILANHPSRKKKP